MAKKSLNLFTILFFTFIFLLNACDTTTDDTEKQEDTKIVSPSESTNDNEEKKDETEPRIVGSWQTEEEFNFQNGFSFAYEITADNKITYTMTYIYDVQLSPDEEPIITEGQYMKLIGKVSSVTESVIKVTDMKVSADSTISSDIITQMIGDLSASNSVEIEYKDLTKSSVKILNTEIDENDNEIETWITLVKVGKSTENDNTGNNDNNNDNEEKKDETEPRIVGSWQTEEEFNFQNGFSFAYEITADNKITYTMTYIYDVQLSPDEEPIITEGQYMKLIGKVSSVTESVIKVTDMKVSADSTISSDIITQMIGDLSASNSVEIEYKDLTKSSVKILNTEIDENDNEIETWITLVKVGESTENDNTGNNDNNNDNNTEYSIIGTWTGIKNLNTGDFSIDFKITYVITEKNFTLIFENITTDEDLKITQTTESTITKFEENKIYLISDNPENPGEKINSTFNYKDLTADSVKIYLEGYNEWITFKKVTNTNNNENNDNGDNKDDDTEYSIIGSWGFTQTIENTDGTSMEMKVTYVITADKITSYAEVNGQKSTYEMTITKIENGKIYCIGLSPVDNTTEIESILMYKDLTADSVKITTYSVEESDTWIIFTKIN